MVGKLNSIMAWFQADPRRLVLVVMLVITVLAMVGLVAPTSVALAGGGGGNCCAPTP